MSQITSYQGGFLPPGQLPSIESIEQELTSVIWNRLELALIGSNTLISGAAVDAGNTGYTKVLRTGLLLTKDTDGDFVDFGSIGGLGVDKVEGVLLMTTRVDRFGANQDRYLGYVMLGGPVKVNGIIVPGASSTAGNLVGHANEAYIRGTMKLGFQFDDDPLNHNAA